MKKKAASLRPLQNDSVLLTNEVFNMDEQSKDQIRAAVREQYGEVARTNGAAGCATSCAPGCCTPGAALAIGAEASLKLGYSSEDFAGLPDGANMGLGCGNPQAIGALKPGEVVLDLGSGGGFDCFLAAKQVGPAGSVIGVDMTSEMVAKARANARILKSTNVDFRLGEIERLPVADSSIDVILSNCVINLSPDKTAVFQEAFRVLKPGGRLAISDVVAIAEIPEELMRQVLALTGCVSGAERTDTLAKVLRDVGFEDINIQVKEESRVFIRDWMPGSGAENYVASANITAIKPGAKSCCGPSCCTPEASA